MTDFLKSIDNARLVLGNAGHHDLARDMASLIHFLGLSDASPAQRTGEYLKGALEIVRQLQRMTLPTDAMEDGAIYNADDDGVALRRLIEMARKRAGISIPQETNKWVICALENGASFTKSGKYWHVQDTREESWVVGAESRCKTKSAAAEMFCEEQGYAPD